MLVQWAPFWSNFPLFLSLFINSTLRFLFNFFKGILDRYEGELAVILIEEENEELIVKKTELPPGSKENTIFNLSKQNGDYVIEGINMEATKKAQQKSTSLMQQLRAKSKGSKFKRR